jgi:23S rRNA pseudouridine1911/1915/1917 synthase
VNESIGGVYHRVFTADRGDDRRRLDRVLHRHLAGAPGITRTRLQQWIADGRVEVNGISARRPAHRTACGDVVVARVPHQPLGGHRPAPAGEDLPLTVLYEDDDLLVVDKPAGVVAHPTYGHATGTLLNALLRHAQGWPAPARPSLVGRLDRFTSGLLVVAKTAATHARLQRELTSGASEKHYLAVVHGRVNVAHGRIALRLHRDPHDRRRVIASAVAGAASVTTFERLARSDRPGPALSLLRCRLLTGRMHQIRAHLAARGWPLVGDPVYGPSRTSLEAADPGPPVVRDFPRQALHAWRVAFRHPATGARVDVEAPIPSDLRSIVEGCFGAQDAWGRSVRAL